MTKHDLKTGTWRFLFGIGGLTTGLALLGYAAWSANEGIRNNGGLAPNATSGMPLEAGCAGAILLVLGVPTAYGGWKDRGRARAIRNATAVTPPDASPWQPPPGVTDHLVGRAFTSDLEFFAPPPHEIGKILTADTSLRFGDDALLFASHAKNVLAVGLIAGATAWLVMRVTEPNDPPAGWVGGALCGCLAAALAWVKDRPRHACYYAGERGVARYVAVGRRRRIITGERFLFENATELSSGRVDQLMEGVYLRTGFRFDWLDANGEFVFQIAGTYNRDRPGRDPLTDMLFQWGLAAQQAWQNRA